MIFAFLLVPILAFSSVIQDDVTTTDKSTYSFKTVCEKMVTHESPLIDVVSGTELDCMGKKVAVGKFCEQELAQDPYYIRGYVDRDLHQVVCQSGKKVLFKYQCVKLNDQPYCSNNPKAACSQIREKLANRLDMVHSSVTQNDKGIKQLNCYFESLPLKERKLGTR